MNMKTLGAAALMLAFAASAGAADLLLTQGAAKRGDKASMVGIDIVSDGDVRGFDFVIPVEKGMKVDTSRCLSNMPKGFQGTCTFNGTEVAGLVFSWEPQTLPKGVHTVGTISFSGRTLAKSALTAKFNAADTNAQPITGKVIVD